MIYDEPKSYKRIFLSFTERWASPITRSLPVLWRCGIQSAAELRWLITWKCADRSDAFWAWSWAPNKELWVVCALLLSIKTRKSNAQIADFYRVPNCCVNWKIIMIKHEKQKRVENYTNNKKNHFLVCFQIFRKELSDLARSEIAAIVRRASTQKPAQVERDWSIFQKKVLLRAKREERKSFQFLLFFSEESYQSWKSDFSLIFLSCVVCFWLLRESWLVSSDASCEK